MRAHAASSEEGQLTSHPLPILESSLHERWKPWQSSKVLEHNYRDSLKRAVVLYTSLQSNLGPTTLLSFVLLLEPRTDQGTYGRTDGHSSRGKKPASRVGKTIKNKKKLGKKPTGQQSVTKHDIVWARYNFKKEPSGEDQWTFLLSSWKVVVGNKNFPSHLAARAMVLWVSSTAFKGQRIWNLSHLDRIIVLPVFDVPPEAFLSRSTHRPTLRKCLLLLFPWSGILHFFVYLQRQTTAILLLLLLQQGCIIHPDDGLRAAAGARFRSPALSSPGLTTTAKRRRLSSPPPPSTCVPPAPSAATATTPPTAAAQAQAAALSAAATSQQVAAAIAATSSPAAPGVPAAAAAAATLPTPTVHPHHILQANNNLLAAAAAANRPQASSISRLLTSVAVANQQRAAAAAAVAVQPQTPNKSGSILTSTPTPTSSASNNSSAVQQQQKNNNGNSNNMESSGNLSQSMDSVNTVPGEEEVSTVMKTCSFIDVLWLESEMDTGLFRCSNHASWKWGKKRTCPANDVFSLRSFLRYYRMMASSFVSWTFFTEKNSRSHASPSFPSCELGRFSRIDHFSVSVSRRITNI